MKTARMYARSRRHNRGMLHAMKTAPVIAAVCLSSLGFAFKSDTSELHFANLDAPAVQNFTERAEAGTINRTEEKLAGISAKDLLKDVSAESIRSVRLTWKTVPGAVKYKVSYGSESLIAYTNGVEIPENIADRDIKITALNVSGDPVKENVAIKTAEANPARPQTTSEYDKMDYSPLYPVYSWIPVPGAKSYGLELLKDGEVIRERVLHFNAEDDDFTCYDWEPVVEEGEYYWRVRALDENELPITNWSEKNQGNTFSVTHKIRFAALGDSITHGGGSLTVPPSMVMCNWENYCNLPVKNLGRSGDTTENMLNRFDRDVLPFHPEVLIIMAGVNDFRGDILSWRSIVNLREIRDKCKENGIKPVFVTPTPINPKLIQKVGYIEIPPYDWQTHMENICEWIREQEFYIDITPDFRDSEGDLKENLTTDGLHPDAEGKQIMGRAVAAWLNNYLDSLQPRI